MIATTNFKDIRFINSEIEFKNYETLDSNYFDRNPYQSNNTICNYTFKIWVIQLLDGNGNMNVQTNNGLSGFATYISSNYSHFLYEINVNSAIGQIGDQILIKATGGGIENTLTIPITCNEFNINNIDIETGFKIYYDWFLGHILFFKTIGVPSYVDIGIESDNSFKYAKLIEPGYYFYQINYGNRYDKSLSGSIDFYFYFSGQSIRKSVYGYYNSLFDDPNININYYPSDFANLIELTGRSLYPLMTIEIKTQPQPIEPYFAFVSDYGGYLGQFAPIYESNNITTYIVSPYMPVLFQSQTSFYTQKLTSAYQIFNYSFSIKDIDITTISLTDFSKDVVISGSPLLNVYTSASLANYKLNLFKFSLNSKSIFVGAPFGFEGPSNSMFDYTFSLPLNNYNPSISFGVEFISETINIPGNSNQMDYQAPVILSYEFIYIRNYIYIFRAEILDDGCGVGYISFDNIIQKRLSQFLVSGDSVKGVYEIPIDFNLDTFFSTVAIFDLCNNVNRYQHNILPFVGFKPFIVPFLSNKYALQTKVNNVTYLYNNLDVRDQPVANIIYFTCDDAAPTTPFSFRPPISDIYEYNTFFTHEYFGSWNSTINKFQIEFVVPKNSRLGPFEFSIANGLDNFVSSEYLPSSAQLIISKSNFDGIGPIFSKVEKIPFNNGKFGWSLTISDPINGFDNGTITVTGSEDNSIYKFDLFPTNRTSGNSTEGVYEIIIDLGSNYCIDQDYIITFVKLWDTGAQFTVFELDSINQRVIINQLINPFYLFLGISTINKYSIQECNAIEKDTSAPYLVSFQYLSSVINVGLPNRDVRFQFEIEDPDSGINTRAQGPIIYIASESLDMVQCISTFLTNTSEYNALYECTTELPIGFASTYSFVYFSIYGIINNHGLYSGLSSQTLKEEEVFDYMASIEYSTNDPLLFDSGIAPSKGGEYFVYGRTLSDVKTLTILDASNGSVISVYSNINIFGNSVILISNFQPITNNFYILVTNSLGESSNKLLVSPVIFNSYTPSEDSSNSNSESNPFPTNSPQQCLGSPICGGPTHGICNTQTGCICIYPWKGKSCQDKVIEPEQPVVDPNEPSTGIDIPDDTDDNGNPVNNIHYKSLISLYSLREVDINGNTVKNYKFNDNWEFNQISTLISNYKTNVTTIDNSFNTTISATLEWFNQSKVITFADQDLEMNANSIKYSIEISKYPFTNSLNYLQLVMSATLTSTSSTSCSSKDFGDTTTGDNSNYINIQIDNKSLYGRFIKRGIVDNNKVVALSNEILDSKLNAISTPSQSQRYVGITIPQFKERAIIDPDFSVLLNSDSASSKSNSVCKSKGLSGAKIAGIVIGSVAFVAIIVISVIYHFKKKKDDQIFKANISNKLKEMNNNNT